LKIFGEKAHHSFGREKKEEEKKKRGGDMPMKTRRKNTSEAQQMLFCYCMFCTNGAGVLKSTHLWFAWFACLRFSPGFVGRDLPGIRETAWPQIG